MLAGVDSLIGDEGVKALSEALKLHNSVTTIDLRGEFCVLMGSSRDVGCCSQSNWR